MNAEAGFKHHTHTVPRYYLSAFTESPGSSFIWEYKKTPPYNPGDKWMNNPRKVSIGNATVKKNFYAYPQGDGTLDFNVIENELEKMEKRADPIFQKLRSRQNINEEEKGVFTEYLVLMDKRMPRYRNGFTTCLGESIDEYKLPREQFERLPGATDVEKQAELDSIKLRAKEDKNFPVQAHLKALTDISFSPLLPVIKDMFWRFFVAPRGRAFLTCDHPMYFTRYIGLGNKDSQVSLPISSEICLVASWKELQGSTFLEAPSEVLKLLNKRTANMGGDCLYFCRKEKWIIDFFENWTEKSTDKPVE